MVKSYLKYELFNSFGAICSPSCNSIAKYRSNKVVTGNQSINLATDDSISIWDTRTNALVHSLTRNVASNDMFSPTFILSNGSDVIYAGYSDGSICIWKGYHLDITFHGHKGKVLSLAVSCDYSLLASGGNDTNIIVWDLVSKVGICCLRGHLNQITSLVFTNTTNQLLISGSKDGVIRIWDHCANICLQSLVDSPDEIWSIAISNSATELYVGTKTIRLYHFNHEGSLEDSHTYAKFRASIPKVSLVGENFLFKTIKICNFGDGEFLFDDILEGGLLIASGNSKFILFYRMYASSEQIKRAKKRAKRDLERLKSKCESMKALIISAGLVDEIPQFDSISDEYEYLESLLSDKIATSTEVDLINDIMFLFALNVKNRVKSFQVTRDDYFDNYSIKLIVAHVNNTMTFWDIPLKDIFNSDYSKHNLHSSISNYHTSPINSLSISNDDTLILSISSFEIKLWDISTGNSIKTFNVTDATCGFIISGNDVIFFGTKNGDLSMIYVNTCETINISSGDEIVSIAQYPQMDSFVLARINGTIETYKIILTGSSISCEMTSSFNSSDKPTDAVVSKNQNLIAIGQLDGTIQTFYCDSKKLHLMLYGHKLPILSIAISSDSTLLASSSNDKTLKIWGLDFGNIYKSFTSTNVITCVNWIPLTHYTLSVDQQGSLFMHDIDKFQQVFAMQVHCQPSLSVAINSDGSFFATCGKDCTIKVWKITDKQLFIQEELEKDMELSAVREDIPHAIPADENVVAFKVTKKNMEIVKSSEHMMQILDDASDGTIDLFGNTPRQYVIKSLIKLDSNVVYDLIITLPFLYAAKLLKYLAETLEIIAKGNLSGLYQTEIICHTALTIVQIYFRQFAVSKGYRTLLNNLKDSIKTILYCQENCIDFNTACIKLYSATTLTHGAVLSDPDDI